MRYISNKPVSNYILSKGVDKLHIYGIKVFMDYAQEQRLSYCDINHCIEKCKMVYGDKELKALPLPPELKDERWQYYTKTLRYHPDKARKLLYEIDKSYEGEQFLPELTTKKPIKST